MPGMHILSLLRFLFFFSGSMIFCNEAPSARAGGLSLLSFWHYISLVPRMQENSSAEVGVRQERQLELWAKVGWKEGRLLWVKIFTKALCERKGFPEELLMLSTAGVNE